MRKAVVGQSRWYSALAVLVAAMPARANPLEVFGLTSQRAGQANTGVAAADDASALYYDPAGLVASPGGELVLGTLGAYSNLAINSVRVSLADPVGFQLAVRARVPLGGALADRVAVGLGLHLLPSHVARVIAPAPDRAFYPYYGDRLSRVVVLPGAAMRLGGGWSIGGAVNVLASLREATYASEVTAGMLDARVDDRVPAVARAIAGVHYELSSSLRVGAVYRQRFEIPFKVRSTTMADGNPIDFDITASSHFTPHQVAVGVVWRTESLASALDVGWAKWSGYAGPYVRVGGKQPAVGPVSGHPPRVPFEDTFSIRAGIESLTSGGLVYRGGYGFESSPVPRDQQGVTNLLDGTKHTVAFGGGYVWKRLRLDVHLSVQLVSTRTATKTIYDGTGEYDPYTSLRDEDSTLAGNQISNPGYPSIKSGGEVFSAGMTVEVPL
jgi:long-chain fatty acid transport protein